MTQMFTPLSPQPALRPGAGSANKRSFLAKFGMMCVILVTLFSFKSEASHYRYGNVSYTYGTGNSVTFHITQSYRSSYFGGIAVGGVVSVGTFNFGDGATANMNLTITSVNTTDDYFIGEASIAHTYSTTGNYTAFFASSARLSTLVNNADAGWRGETHVQIGTEHNSSPVSTVPVIVNVPNGQTVTTFTIPASDPDGQAITFRTATTAEMGVTAANPQPSILTSINSTSGLVTLNTSAAAVTVGQLYNAGFVITDAPGATTMVDFIIKIVQPSNPPIFNYSITPANNYVYNLQPGQTVSFQVSATDTDPGDHATLTAAGLPPGSTVSPSLPATGNPTATVTFSWTPTASQLGSRIVSFIAQDVNGNQTTTNVTIVTSMNPQFDSPPTIAAGSFNCLEAGNLFSTTIQAHAPDPTVTVQITSATVLPGITYSPAIPSTAANVTSTTLNWTPTASQWGPHTLSFTATDNQGHTRNHSYDVVVNTTSTITSAVPNTTIYQNQPFSYNLTVADPDLPYGDMIDIDGIGLPAWLTLTQTSSTTATLSGTPTAADLGNNFVQIDVEDSFHHCHAPVSQTFTLNVQSCAASFASQTSTVNANTNTTSCSASNVTYSAVASSPASITYTYSFSGATTGSGNGTGSGSTFAFGTTAVDVSATTSCGTVHDIFNVIVSDNQAPVLSVPANTTVNSQDPTTTAALGNATATDNCAVQSVTSSDASTQDANVNNAAHYNYTITRTFTATDVHGLTSSTAQMITVHDVTAPVVTAPAAIAVCNNGSGNAQSLTATATDAASSPLTYSYAITGATTGSGTGATAAANFNVGVSTITWTVTDVAGNANTSGTSTVTIYALPSTTVTGTTNITCNGLSNGSINTNTTGGTPGYGYMWTPGGATSGNLTGVPAGTYSLLVTDAHSCHSTAAATLTQPAALVLGTISGTYSNPNCPSFNIYVGYGTTNTTLSAAPAGGTGAYTYTWSPATGVNNIHNAAPVITTTVTNTYTATITDANGCASSSTYQVRVLNVKCGPAYVGRELNNTVYVCHSQSAPSTTVCISPSAVPAHLAHLDCMGICGNNSRGVSDGSDGSLDQFTGATGITIYPNPAHGAINIGLAGMSNLWTAYQITDLSGKLVAERHLDEASVQEVLTIDVSAFRPGMYLIRVAGLPGQESSISKFNVQ